MKRIMMFMITALLAIGLAVGPAYAGADADADARAKIDARDYSKSTSSRQLPGGVYQPPMVNPQYHNAPHTRTWNIFQFSDLAKIRRTWTREQLEVVIDSADGDEGDVTSIAYNAVPAETAKEDRTAYDRISIIFSTRVPKGHFDKGMIQSKGEADTNGLKMAAQSLLDAMNMGGKYLMILVDDAEIQQYTKARTFFIGGGMSALTGDSGSNAGGGGAASGIGAGTITSGKGLAPHAAGVVVAELGDAMMLKDGKAVPMDANAKARMSITNEQDDKAAEMDEPGFVLSPTANATNGNGKVMSEYYTETGQ